MQGRESLIMMVPRREGTFEDIMEQVTSWNRFIWDLNSIAKLLTGKKGVLDRGNGNEQESGEKV